MFPEHSVEHASCIHVGLDTHGLTTVLELQDQTYCKGKFKVFGFYRVDNMFQIICQADRMLEQGFAEDAGDCD